MESSTSIGEHTILHEGIHNLDAIHALAAESEFKPEWFGETAVPRIENPDAYIEKVYTDHSRGLVGLLIKKGSQEDEAEDMFHTAMANFIAYLEQRNWEVKIENPFAFLATSAFRSRISKRVHEKAGKIDSLDIEDSFYEVSDNGNTVAEMHGDSDDQELFNKVVMPFLHEFSAYEIRLMHLWIVENCKPKDAAVVLSQTYEKTSIDMNRVKAKFRKRVKASCTSDSLLKRLKGL